MIVRGEDVTITLIVDGKPMQLRPTSDVAVDEDLDEDLEPSGFGFDFEVEMVGRPADLIFSPRMYRKLEAFYAGRTRRIDRARYNATRKALNVRHRRALRRAARAAGKTVDRYFADFWRSLSTAPSNSQAG